MLKIENINKYFFKHKKNEIHVIDNTSLEFGDVGLVALLGPSGCGKTTLLNAIGGLDKIDSGRIYIDGKKMPKFCSGRRDKIRVLNIGYIFQNYNLLDNLTVFDNVALSLKMIGIKNRFEIKKRVNYCLERTGMYRYRNKLAGSLSGGEQQRVGIARAIVKNPDVIIADEPTGNLDSKNTIEVMNIIKSISEEKLVILVTHESNLAHFYASRIITLEDGHILSDAENTHENELDYRIDNKIYLKDFKYADKFTEKSNQINIYYDKEENVKLNIVLKNNNIYIQSKSFNNIEVVDENSGIELIDDKYKKISKDDYINDSFDLKMLENNKYKLRYTSIYNLGTMIRSGFTKVLNYTFMKKILLIGFFVSAMFIVYAISNIFGVTDIKDSNFLTIHRDYIKIENNKNSLDNFLEIERDENIAYVLPGNSIINLQLDYDRLYQFNDAMINLSASLADKNTISEANLSFGRMPSTANEIVLDEMAIDLAKKGNENFVMANLNDYADFLNLKLKTENIELVVVGISKTSNPCIFTDKSLFFNLIGLSKSNDDKNIYTNSDREDPIYNYELEKDDLKIKRGRAPKNDYEVIANISSRDAYPLNRTINTKVNDNKLKVVGYYSDEKENNKLYVGENTYKYHVITSNEGMMIYAQDKLNSIENLQKRGLFAQDAYNVERENYIKDIKENIMESLIVAGILLAISFVEIFLMIRASFLSRIKEIGIYRAIGTKKADIYKMFLGEILVITTLTSIPGSILMMLIIKEITKISFIGSYYIMNPTVAIISILLIYGLNTLIGLLPITLTIKNTPAEILSRNDVD